MIRTPVFFGTGYQGGVWRYRSTAVQTMFFHVFFVPVLQLGTVLAWEAEPGVIRRQPYDGWLGKTVSSAAGFFRIWPILAAAFLPFTGLSLVVTPLRIVLAAAAVSFVFGWLPGLVAPASHRRCIDGLLDAAET